MTGSSRRRWWLLAFVLVAAAAGVAAFRQAGNFLQAPAQQPVKADLILALGGDTGGRVVTVAELYRQGFAPRILVSQPESAHSKVRATILHWRARYLMDEGVPEAAILLESRARNSWQEAEATLRLMRERKFERVLVVSDPPHLRRLSWVMERVFGGSGKSYVLVAADDENWDAAHWWRTSSSAQYVFGEYIKLAYYLFEY